MFDVAPMTLRLAVIDATSVDGKNVLVVVKTFAAFSRATVPLADGKLNVWPSAEAVSVMVLLTVNVLPDAMNSVPSPISRVARVETGKTDGLTAAKLVAPNSRLLGLMALSGVAVLKSNDAIVHHHCRICTSHCSRFGNPHKRSFGG